jgi:hypothetical protein
MGVVCLRISRLKRQKNISRTSAMSESGAVPINAPRYYSGVRRRMKDRTPKMMRYFHRTGVVPAKAILREGFHDGDRRAGSKRIVGRSVRSAR